MSQVPARSPILALDDLTIGRIAAGEVIERPSSVVKELVENSLDAGATDLRVEFAAGGRRLIRVQDDGSGIPSDQVLLAFQRHATSKLRTSADLEAIATLGFRGEALASIASVSHVTLTTCAAGERVGTLLRIDNGAILLQQPTGAPPGTSFTVENLFAAVPARLKFLKTDATEGGRITELLSQYALAHPGRRFTLVKEGRTVLRSPGTGDVRSALEAVFGADVARQLIAVGDAHPAATPADTGWDSDDEGSPTSAAIRVTGFIGPPHLHRANRRDMTLFVNGRLIHDTTLTYAITQAYHTLLPHGRFPIAVIMIQVPPDTVDVNVHPAKTEVRFRDARPVFSAVERAVRAAVIGQAGVAPFGKPSAVAPFGKPSAVAPFDLRSEAGEARGAASSGGPRSFHALGDVPTPTPRSAFQAGAGRVSGWTSSAGSGVASGADEPVAWRSGSDAAWQNSLAEGYGTDARVAETAPDYPAAPTRSALPDDAGQTPAALPGGAAPAVAGPDGESGAEAGAPLPWPPEPRLPPLRLLGQVGLAYLVAEGPDGMYLIDQHAAHERVMYEELMNRRAAGHRQHLLAPEPVTLSVRQSAAVEEHSELLAAAGYELETFGDNAVLVRSVPEVLAKAEPAAALRNVLDGLQDERAPVDEALEARLVRVVCKQATVKAGQALSPAEARSLVGRLEACASPRTCPHGRPTVVTLSAAQLAAAFGR